MLSEGLGTQQQGTQDVPLGQVPRWDQEGKLPAKGQGTWDFWAVAVPGDVSPLSPRYPFIEPLYPGEPTGIANLRPDKGQGLLPGY